MAIQAPPNLSSGHVRYVDSGRDQRLGRCVAGHARPRQSRGAVATPRATAGQRDWRARARSSPSGSRCIRRYVRQTSGHVGGRRPLRTAAPAGDLTRRDLRARGIHGRQATGDAVLPAKRCCGRLGTTPRRLEADSPTIPRTLCAQVSSRRCRDSTEVGNRGVVHRPGRRPHCRGGAARPNALRQRGQWRRRHLCRQSQHQLHQRLLFQAVNSAPSRRASSARICVVRPTTSTSTKSRRRSVEGWARGAHRGVHARAASIPEYTGATYLEICRAVKVGRSRTCTCTPSPRSRCGRARRRSAYLASRHSCVRLQATPGSGPLPGTAAEVLHDDVRRETLCPDKLSSGPMARGDGHGPSSLGFRDHGHHHVRPHRSPHQLGKASDANSATASENRRVHRIRSIAFRAHGSTDLFERESPQRPDVPRITPHACGRTFGIAPGRSEHPGVVGKDGAAWRG